jgi:type IV secretion system protein TrbL
MTGSAYPADDISHSRYQQIRSTIEDAMTLVLAALSLLGLGIFGPGIANGLVSGGPQLGAGAAIGTGLAAGGVVAAGAGLAAGGAGLAGGAIAGAARGGGAVLSGASAAYRSGGLTGIAEAGASAAMSPLRRASGSNARASEQVASASADGQPDWALRMKRAQTIRHGGPSPSIMTTPLFQAAIWTALPFKSC